MRLPVLIRKVHYWASIALAVPGILIICTGLLLQVKKDLAWVQPAELRGLGDEPSITFEQILAACRSDEAARIHSWADVRRLDLRPTRGLIKVTSTKDWEIQLDAQSGAVLQSAYRRSDIIEAIHDGSWFHESVKRWVFLPAGVLLLLMWLSGMYLFVLPYWVKWRRKGRLAHPAAQPGEAERKPYAG